MVRKKSLRTRGKLKLSKYFQKFSDGDVVSVNLERSQKSNTPKRMQGRTGTIREKKGSSYVVDIKDHAKEKSYIISPIHLTKLKTLEKTKNDN